jgi:hypothetical protein
MESNIGPEFGHSRVYHKLGILNTVAFSFLSPFFSICHPDMNFHSVKASYIQKERRKERKDRKEGNKKKKLKIMKIKKEMQMLPPSFLPDFQTKMLVQVNPYNGKSLANKIKERYNEEIVLL